MEDYIMVNKFNSKTGLIAALLVGMTMSYAPVQAGRYTDKAKQVVGMVWNGTKKATKAVFKGIRVCAGVGLLLGGATFAGYVYTADAEKMLQIREGPSLFVNAYNFIGPKWTCNQEYQQLQNTIDVLWVPGVVLGSTAALLGAYLLVRGWKSEKKAEQDVTVNTYLITCL